jgi:NAD(P)-dependent dehydrogenase (short-subunit alcohol dehydrogenase family)
MTRQLAFDFSHDSIKIRVNGIAPGIWTYLMLNNIQLANDDIQRLVPLRNDHRRLQR